MNKDFVTVPAARKEGAEPAIYRRVIRIVAPEEGVVLGELADDPHHFRVRVRHDGRSVVDIEGEALRYPWTTCPGAVEPLRKLVGMRLDRDAMAAGEYTDSLQNCTHMFDLAGLCIATAASGDAQRRYDCEVTDAEDGATHASVRRAGAVVLEWRLKNSVIQAPQRYADVHLFRRFTLWTREHLEPAEAEAALVLRRACFVAPTRNFDLDRIGVAAELNSTKGVCHSFQPERVFDAYRSKGMQCDFTRNPDDLIELSEEVAIALHGREPRSV